MLSDNEVHYLTNFASPKITPLHVEHYPNEEPLVKWRDFDAITRICVRPKNLETLVATLFWVDALAERGHPAPELVLPCLPGARQDRLNPEGDYLFTAKSVAQMINDRCFPRVITVDPHSEVMPALLENCHVIHSVDVLKARHVPIREYAGVIAPDAGAAKRAMQIAQFLKVPVYQAWKRRSIVDGHITGFGMEPLTALTGDAFLVVDDLCDGGGTFMGLAELLPDAAQLDLFVTHGIFSQGFSGLLKHYTNVITTDSLTPPKQTGRYTCISISQQLLEKGHL